MDNSFLKNYKAILVGVSDYQYESLTPLSAARENTHTLKNLLSSELIGISKKDILIIDNPPSNDELFHKIDSEIIKYKNSKNNILFYYAGHGLTPNLDEKFYLSHTNTLPHKKYTLLDVNMLSEVLGKKNNVFFIIDCCYSERALEYIQQDSFSAIASSRMNETSIFPLDKDYSLFTGAFISIIKDGINNDKTNLSLIDLFYQLKNNLKDKNHTPILKQKGNIPNIVIGKNNFGFSKYKKVNFSLYNSIENLKERINTSTVTYGLNSKKFNDLFISPPLYLLSDKIDSINQEILTQKKNPISLKEIIHDNKNYILLGKKEFGKTGIMKAIILKSITPNFLCIYIKFRQIALRPNEGKISIKKNICDYLSIHHLKDEERFQYIEKKIKIILIDNVEFDDNDRLEIIHSIMISTPHIRYILASRISSYDDVKIKDKQYLSFKKKGNFNCVEIQSLKKKQLFKLTNLWFKNELQDYDLKRKRRQLLSTLMVSGMEHNPLNASLLLWTIELSKEKKDNLTKPYLIKTFVEKLLEKNISTKPDYTKIDLYLTPSQKYNFLAELGEKMVRGGLYEINSENLEKFIKEYIHKRLGIGKVNTSNFIKYFLIKNIFSKKKLEEIIYYSFKFSCVEEYFIALRMVDNVSFKEYILNNKRYLKFDNEIVYFSAFQRNNDELLLEIESRIRIIYEQLYFGLSSKASKLKNIDPSIFEDNNFPFKVEDILDLYLENDISFNSGNKYELFFHNIDLFSRIFKNCEFESEASKRDRLEASLFYWSKSILLACSLVMEYLVKEEIDFLKEKQDLSLETEVKNFHQKIKNTILVNIPFLIQKSFMESIGSSSNNRLLKNDNNYSFLVNFLALFTYADFELPGFSSKLEKFFEIIPNEIHIMKLFVTKTEHIYINFIEDKEDAIKTLESILKRAIRKIHPRADTSKYLSKLKKQRLRAQRF